MYCELLPILEKDIVVLTANQRLCRHLYQQFAQYQVTQQKKARWNTPTILPLNTWLKNFWQQHPDGKGKLLSDFQAQWCWQNIIRDTDNAAPFLATKSTAALAKAAWDTLTLWNLGIEKIDTVNEEVSIFVQWAQEFQNIKAHNDWVCSAELPTESLKLLNKNQPSLPQQVILVGFDEFAPAVQQLLDTMKHYTEVTEYAATPKTPTIHQVRLSNEEHELTTMARWAKKHYEQGIIQRIGCIVPNLATIRKAVDRIFTEVFAPHHKLAGTTPTSLPFNISMGQNLNSFPIIRCALHVLGIKLNAITFDDLSQLLRSIYINSDTDDACYAASLERNIRQLNQLHLNPDALRAQLGKLNNVFPQATFPARWESFLNTYHQGDQQTASQWASAFINELTQIGWPGQRNLTSHEYQIVTRFEKIFVEFAELDTFTPLLARQQALHLFVQLVAQAIFQPENPKQGIQILGTLEATGIEFDALWIMGLSNENWPAATQPNPFLPIALQRTQGMPHASPSRELRYTQHLQERLFNSASNIVISSPLQQQDKQLLPSRLIHHIPSINRDDLNLAHTQNLIEQIFAARHMETIKDTMGPKLTPHEIIHGGHSILQQQALCPFRAFAAIRLQAEALAKPQLGLNAAERGTLVHHALQQVWQKLKTQQQLKLTTPTELKNLVTTTALTIIKNYPAHQRQFLNVENKRLVALLMEWLDFEKTRPPFTVDQRESVRFVTIGDLPLKLKIDRIDKLADDNELIIDYKTGNKNNIDDWFGDRPHSLQLPLYATYGSQHAFGLAYAQVRSGDIAFKGLTAGGDQNNKKFYKITPIQKYDKNAAHLSWQDTLDHWRNVLLRLSSEFCSGQAIVDPVDPALACRYCDLQPFCRIGTHHDDE